MSGGLKHDLPLGLYIVRGDNVVLLGEIDNEKEVSAEAGWGRSGGRERVVRLEDHSRGDQ